MRRGSPPGAAGAELRRTPGEGRARGAAKRRARPGTLYPPSSGECSFLGVVEGIVSEHRDEHLELAIG